MQWHRCNMLIRNNKWELTGAVLICRLRLAFTLSTDCIWANWKYMYITTADRNIIVNKNIALRIFCSVGMVEWVEYVLPESMSLVGQCSLLVGCLKSFDKIPFCSVFYSFEEGSIKYVMHHPSWLLVVCSNWHSPALPPLFIF